MQLRLLHHSRLLVSIDLCSVNRVLDMERFHHCTADRIRPLWPRPRLLRLRLDHSCGLHRILHVLPRLLHLQHTFRILRHPLRWTNTFEAKRFPIFSSHAFDSQGNGFDITRVLDPKNLQLDLDAYENYSKIYLSVFFAFTYGLSFATLSATICHVFLFHGK